MSKGGMGANTCYWGRKGRRRKKRSSKKPTIKRACAINAGTLVSRIVPLGKRGVGRKKSL